MDEHGMEKIGVHIPCWQRTQERNLVMSCTPYLDQFVSNHVEHWAIEHLPYDDREELRSLIFPLIRNDPDLLVTHYATEIHDLADLP